MGSGTQRIKSHREAGGEGIGGRDEKWTGEERIDGWSGGGKTVDSNLKFGSMLRV